MSGRRLFGGNFHQLRIRLAIHLCPRTQARERVAFLLPGALPAAADQEWLVPDRGEHQQQALPYIWG
jgi:hypothetical protein